MWFRRTPRRAMQSSQVRLGWAACLVDPLIALDTIIALTKEAEGSLRCEPAVYR